MTLEELQYRFLGKVKRNDATGCLEWQYGLRKGKPYGQFWWGGFDGGPDNMQAHRAAWTLFKGPIPADKMVLHKCNNGICCEWEGEGHLYLGDHDRNMKDREESGRTSKWDKRYNFKRDDDLLRRIKLAVTEGNTMAQVVGLLAISWQTLYRCRDQDPELKALMAATKSARYSAAARRRANGH